MKSKIHHDIVMEELNGLRTHINARIDELSDTIRNGLKSLSSPAFEEPECRYISIELIFKQIRYEHRETKVSRHLYAHFFPVLDSPLLLFIRLVEYEMFIVPSYYCCWFGSKSDGSDWLVVWMIPHAPKFQADCRDADGNFDVFISCYNNGGYEKTSNLQNGLYYCKFDLMHCFIFIGSMI
ncbi:hypothetical protein KSP40_PGU021744 [Platanthera guangdongensis]|uniref:Uncharacterized protein n=1 Tax=Platanthera guangdongensis TaxID=2320717 RepID=A0ABR2MDD3_9ASPA